MRNVRVPIYGTPSKSAVIDPNATVGATIGKDLRWSDGTLVKESDLRSSTPSTGDSTGIDTTDDLDEGAYNQYFTNRRAITAVGEALDDADNITFLFDPDALSITADLTDTGVVAGAYGDATHVPVLTVDDKGRVTSADVVALSPSFVPYFMPDGTVFVVPKNAQALWTIPIELDGDAGLEIDGALVEVN
jgi:hypothetical protein